MDNQNAQAVELELVAGTKYFFCTCGLSKNFPHCDGSHKGTGLKSMHYTTEKSGKFVYRRPAAPASTVG